MVMVSSVSDNVRSRRPANTRDGKLPGRISHGVQAGSCIQTEPMAPAEASTLSGDVSAEYLLAPRVRIVVASIDQLRGGVMVTFPRQQAESQLPLEARTYPCWPRRPPWASARSLKPWGKEKYLGDSINSSERCWLLDKSSGPCLKNSPAACRIQPDRARLERCRISDDYPQ